MKLKNKKTGEIIDVYKGQILLHYNQGKKTIQFKSIEELEEWEDYEEPKEYWFIRDHTSFVGYAPADNNATAKYRKEIVGNYFETKEEAEKAVKKLEAWKRLKDKGFKFERWLVGGEYGNTITFSDYIKYDNETRADLDLLFGGEE